MIGFLYDKRYIIPLLFVSAKQHKIQNDTAEVETSVAKVRRQHAFLSADINGNPQRTKVWLTKETQWPGLSTYTLAKHILVCYVA